MIADALSAVYGAAATWRRRWYAGGGTRTRHLASPVVSVGNLRVGGTGKTPTVDALARILLARGERPAILSRGYGREKATSGVTVVSDRDRVIADLARSGDEPLLLARRLPGVPVLVCADRYRAGRYAETHFDATVHLLDDGFQHVQLKRDVDLLLIDDEDLADRVLPAGRLREPIANAAAADALIVPAGSASHARAIAKQLGIRDAFTLARAFGAVRVLGSGDAAPVSPSLRLLAVAGIARPERFFSQLEQSGLQVVGTRAYRDHHPFDAEDLERIDESVRATQADAVVTTEKDAVRLEPFAGRAVPFLVVTLDTTIEPESDFAGWLLRRIAAARAARVDAS